MSITSRIILTLIIVCIIAFIVFAAYEANLIPGYIPIDIHVVDPAVLNEMILELQSLTKKLKTEFNAIKAAMSDAGTKLLAYASAKIYFEPPEASVMQSSMVKVQASIAKAEPFLVPFEAAVAPLIITMNQPDTATLKTQTKYDELFPIISYELPTELAGLSRDLLLSVDTIVSHYAPCKTTIQDECMPMVPDSLIDNLQPLSQIMLGHSSSLKDTATKINDVYGRITDYVDS